MLRVVALMVSCMPTPAPAASPHALRAHMARTCGEANDVKKNAVLLRVPPMAVAMSQAASYWPARLGSAPSPARPRSAFATQRKAASNPGSMGGRVAFARFAALKPRGSVRAAKRSRHNLKLKLPSIHRGCCVTSRSRSCRRTLSPCGARRRSRTGRGRASRPPALARTRSGRRQRPRGS